MDDCENRILVKCLPIKSLSFKRRIEIQPQKTFECKKRKKNARLL